MLAIEGVEPIATPVHHLLDDGSFAITVPVDGLVADLVGRRGHRRCTQAVLEMTDYAPLPLREPVRSLVWIRGRLQAVPRDGHPGLLDLIAAADPNPALLQVNYRPTNADGDTSLTLVRLEVESVVVADSTGAEAVGVGALLQARPDPFCAHGVLLVAAPRDRPPRRRRPARRPAARTRCGADASVRSASTATACGCGWRTTTATTTCGWRSPSPSTT